MTLLGWYIGTVSLCLDCAATLVIRGKIMELPGVLLEVSFCSSRWDKAVGLNKAQTIILADLSSSANTAQVCKSKTIVPLPYLKA